jgi:hypothetical protein
MKNKRKLILCAIAISVFGATAISAAAVTSGEVVVSPSSPTALSTITLSTTLSGAAPSEVRVTVEECNGNTGVCYPDIQNVSMSLVSGGNYQTDVTLKHADATYITCQVVVKADGTWASYSKKTINLSEGSNGTPNGNNDHIPGFEVVLFIAAVGVSFIVLGRKRVK